MNVLVVLIPVSLLLGLLGLIGFLWTIRTDHYEDPLGQASRILMTDDDTQAADQCAEGGAQDQTRFGELNAIKGAGLGGGQT